MANYRDKVVLLPPNRVWRSYTGGALLDQISGASTPADNHFPEDWIGSLTRAISPGREEIAEGISTAIVDEQSCDFGTLLASDPDYFLGADHVAKHGPSPMLLIKFLDPAIRLHFQCHPSQEFARRVLNSPSGKTEAYHILRTRPEESAPFIYVGFQRPPDPADLKRWIETQDIAAIEACFDKIPVKRGDTFLIPGGVPHALGPGVFMVEIQEPTDFVARYEFQRGGYELPEAARFMGRDVDFGVSLIDFMPRPLSAIETHSRCGPRDRQERGPASWQETLIGPDQTPCFRVGRTCFADPITKAEDSFYIGIVTAGSLELHVGDQSLQLNTYDKFFCPAGLESLELRPHGNAEILECYPPL
ncbi:class I mannose-6-phosphate isomerase [Synoicihabitans lomoniglobus]|uniref:Class I mannose-6-phosphate isomerase n=1 Tax=Synoicihabitans lomoniglobus TaxID=2909285 RepID=A0AAF0CSH1_9BACT|nr:class I mannose-6-phosphate isomerase [Opitutaceae bacterium LMO-M01]WED67211.1 class I mannose-6-phosphate isomerase [Opitutaceae bacterium LMO-M01]